MASRVASALSTLSLAWLVLSAVACSADVAPPVVPGAPVPARLEVETIAGAEVHVDGVFVGTAPLPLPVDADPGLHRVVVTMDGHETRLADVSLLRGVTRTLEIDLDETQQRTWSWVFVGTGLSAIAAGIGFGVAAVVEHRVAVNLDQEGNESSDAYDAAVAARDDYRLGSGLTGGAGLAMLVVGAFLFAFDPADPVSTSDRSGATVVPLLGPGQLGASTVVSF